MSEQMALTEPLTARVPTRITIQNMTGSQLHYWSAGGGGGGAARRKREQHALPHGRAEKLRVEPLRRVIKMVGQGGLVVTPHRTGIINLKLE
eukprot:112670-Chlamydomonas_euryale.AAC.1